MDAPQLKSLLENGGKRNPFWIAGPCVLESASTNDTIADHLKTTADRLKIPLLFKASFDKANRTSGKSPRGPGIQEGLKELDRIRKKFEIPVLTDIHEPAHARMCAEVVDVLQIPAFLCRQTDLIEAACDTGKLVNVKKGQFMGPHQVPHLVEKLKASRGFWITERGVSFGYQRLVVDFAAFPEIERSGARLIMDITHAVQLPGRTAGVSGGIREAIPYLARAAAAVGVYGFFAETHPHPTQALSDGPNAIPLSEIESVMSIVQRIANASHG